MRIGRARGGAGLPGRFENLVDRGELALVVADPGRRNFLVRANEKRGRPRDVPGIDPDAMPHAVRLQDVAAGVDQDVEWQPRFLDVMPDRVARLRDDADDLDAERGEVIGVPGELAKLAAAVRSPGPAMKHEEQPSVREQIHQRPHMPF
jgi:hypothetical protein